MRILALMMLMVVGCGKTAEEKVVGTYEAKKDGEFLRYIFIKDGLFESYLNGGGKEEGTWKVVGEEVHIRQKWVGVLKIGTNGDLTMIARIKEGNRETVPNEFNITLKKIK